ncbi:MAG TPA: glycosyltransferase family 39 protein, partial [Bacteroidia bacterium]|nr:glycosyltransferase family 39 protein [Bacteroidia bacterium]
FKSFFVFIFSFSILSFFWFGIEMMQNGTWFVKEFFVYQLNLLLTPVAGHHGPLYYHFVVVFLGCFPISVLALPVLFRKQYVENSEFTGLMKILFWVVMILFTIVTTKIVHYSSLSYIPLSFLASIYIHHLIKHKIKIAGYVSKLLIAIGTVFSVLLIAAPLAAQHKEWLIPYLKDPFAVACLENPVPWSGYEFIIGMIYLIGVVISIFIIKHKDVMKGILILFYSTAFCMFFYLAAVVPKIEAYSQAPAINFYKSLAGKDVYVIPAGFKSYAHYFYFQKPALTKFKEHEEDSLLNGKIDKPSYFVTKITNREFFRSHPDCEFLKQAGGFLFYRRIPVK